VLGDARCLDTVATLGHRLPDGPDVLQLAGPASVRRWLGADLHTSPLDREPVTAGA
jgi:urease accessory protein